MPAATCRELFLHVSKSTCWCNFQESPTHSHQNKKQPSSSASHKEANPAFSKSTKTLHSRKTAATSLSWFIAALAGLPVWTSDECTTKTRKPHLPEQLRLIQAAFFSCSSSQEHGISDKKLRFWLQYPGNAWTDKHVYKNVCQMHKCKLKWTWYS